MGLGRGFVLGDNLRGREFMLEVWLKGEGFVLAGGLEGGGCVLEGKDGGETMCTWKNSSLVRGHNTCPALRAGNPYYTTAYSSYQQSTFFGRADTFQASLLGAMVKKELLRFCISMGSYGNCW